MSKLSFVKYQGAGNDFLLIDDRAASFSKAWTAPLCDRKFGVGADGVILLQTDAQADFRMRIFNSDGGEAESCGNGLRCFVRFLKDLGIEGETFRIAIGERIVKAFVQGEKVAVELGPVLQARELTVENLRVFSLNTGVPHAVVFGEYDLQSLARLLRHHSTWGPQGTNVNVARLNENGSLSLRTFERGVEGETLACGTGALAAAWAARQAHGLPNCIEVCCLGGNLIVEVEEGRLIGDAVRVFSGWTELF